MFSTLQRACMVPMYTSIRSAVAIQKLTIATVPRVAREDKSVVVNWNKPTENAWSKFHFKWLRDNCQCTSCHHPVYQQRLLNTLEDATPASVNGADSSVQVEWKDGHRSVFSYDWLLANSYHHSNVTSPAAPEERQRTLWDSASMTDPVAPRVDYNQVMKDDKSLLEMLKNVYRYGFCFVGNTPADEIGIVEAAKRVGPINYTYYGQKFVVELGKKELDVNHAAYTGQKSYAHTDNASFHDTSGLFFFHVEGYDGEGGGSELWDGFKMAAYTKQRHPKYFTLLSNVSFRYNLLFKDKALKGEAVYESRRKTFTVDDQGKMAAVYLHQLDRKPLDATSLAEAQAALSCGPDEAMDKMYKAFVYLHELFYGDQFVHKFDLRPGNMLVMDNHRVFHGRDEFVGNHRKATGMYVNQEEWYSKMEILEQFCLN